MIAFDRNLLGCRPRQYHCLRKPQPDFIVQIEGGRIFTINPSICDQILECMAFLDRTIALQNSNNNKLAMLLVAAQPVKITTSYDNR